MPCFKRGGVVLLLLRSVILVGPRPWLRRSMLLPRRVARLSMRSPVRKCHGATVREVLRRRLDTARRILFTDQRSETATDPPTALLEVKVVRSLSIAELLAMKLRKLGQ